jgi:hypothetical protein
MESRDIERELKAVSDLSAEIRGRFLDLAIWVEVILCDIIARHFCPDEDRYSLFYSLIMNDPGLTFSTKSRVFKNTLEHCYPHLLDAHPHVIRQLEKMRRYRNRLAHSLVDTSEPVLSKGYKDRIQLIYYEKGRMKQEVITIKQSRTKLVEASACIRELVAVQEEVYTRLGV